eukprot:TRINITY_DN3030_c0_g2_i1.p1 TRINITY_DN3030_c0_g2~~TRINITY_DN3030_c0_g2_i1.p1  ORF type:complete len:1204 (+),score=315.05 TRINITY_DN3030_c0_g2_i1:114-3725(+)
MRAAKAVKDAQAAHGEALAGSPHALAFCFAEQLERLITESIGTIEDYVVRVLLPLLKAILEELCASQPAHPAVYLSLWLLEQAGAPGGALDELQKWSSKGQFNVFPWGSSSKAGLQRKTPEEPLKEPPQQQQMAPARPQPESTDPDVPTLSGTGGVKLMVSSPTKEMQFTPSAGGPVARPASPAAPRTPVVPPAPPPSSQAKPRRSILRDSSAKDAKERETAAADASQKGASSSKEDESSEKSSPRLMPMPPSAKTAAPRKSILKPSNFGRDLQKKADASKAADPGSADAAAAGGAASASADAKPVSAMRRASDLRFAPNPVEEKAIQRYETVAEDGEEQSDDSDKNVDENDGYAEKDLAAMTQLRGYLGASNSGDSRKQSMNSSLDKRRFTVNIPSMPAPMPPENETLPLLKNVTAFEGLEDEELRRILGIARCRIFHADEPITSFGTQSDEVHVVLSGKCKVSVPRMIGYAEVGAVFGEESLQYAGATCPNLVEAFEGPITTMSISASSYSRLNVKKQQLKKANTERRARGAGDRSRSHSTVLDRDISKDSGRPIQTSYVQTDADRELIMMAVKNNKVLAEVLQLTDDQCQLIADSVHPISLPVGETLMKKGDHGSALYILGEGVLEVLLGSETESQIRIRAGDSFGELALLYDTPRAATIKALGDCMLWVLPRSDFMAVSKMMYSARITAYSEMIGRIPLLSKMVDKDNRDMIADALEEISFLLDDEVCVEGEDVGLLYIIFEGECEVYRGEQLERTLRAGDWIGEEQLEKSIAAEFTVVVTSARATALVLDGSSLQMATKALQLMRKSISHTASENLAGGESRRSQIDHLEKEKFADTVVGKNLSRRQSRRSFQQRNSVSRHSLVARNKDYELTKMDNLGLLGVGSFGTVSMLQDSAGEQFALKMLKKEQILKENLKECLVNERRVMMALDSLFIVKLFKSYQDNDHVFLLLEALTGGELFDIYVDNDLFGKSEHSMFYISCVILGLQHMHVNRVVYRDLKLENCIIDVKGFLKLTDMGISKIVLGKTYTVCGTADYLAPETLKRLGHNRAVDWWACGILLFIMSEGRSPFDAPDVSQIYKNIIKGISKVNFPEWFPSELTEVIKSLCRKKPEDRVTMQKGGVANLTQMQFFSGMDWEQLAEHKIVPPYVPDGGGEKKFKKLPSKGGKGQCNLELANEWDGRCETLNGVLSSSPPAKDE